MTRISVIPHLPTLHFYRKALRVTRLATQRSVEKKKTSMVEIQRDPLSHLRNKIQYNIREGISIYQKDRDLEKIQQLIHDAEKDLAMIQAWKHVDPLWLKRIFKEPTAKKK